MAKPESLFIYVGTYPGEAQARDDCQIIKDLRSAGAVETYDASVGGVGVSPKDIDQAVREAAGEAR